jgi:hypothetical protein
MDYTLNTTNQDFTTKRDHTTQNLSHKHKAILKLLSKKEKRSQTQEIEFLIEKHADLLGVEYA